MTEHLNATLIKLSDTDLTIADLGDDVRGKKVVDRDGNEVGKIEDILIDEQERKARLLQCGSGGFLGIGEEKRLIPVEAVTAVHETVEIDTTGETVAASAAYDPDLAPEQDQFTEVYRHYGHQPFWGSGLGA